MSSQVPTIKIISWISIIPQTIVMGILILSFYPFYPKKAFLLGFGAYLILFLMLRNFVPRNHRIGMQLVKKQQFSDAISHFEKSYHFFSQNNWIDRFRYITVLSSSKMSFKEMALNNIAFCYAQLGNGAKSKEYYEKTLSEFPSSGLAKAGLNFLITGERNRNN